MLHTDNKSEGPLARPIGPNGGIRMSHVGTWAVMMYHDRPSSPPPLPAWRSAVVTQAKTVPVEVDGNRLGLLVDRLDSVFHATTHLGDTWFRIHFSPQLKFQLQTGGARSTPSPLSLSQLQRAQAEVALAPFVFAILCFV